MGNTVSLKNKTMSGLFWSFIDLLARQGIQFVIQIILARLLMPEHFGLMGMIILFIAISNSLIDSGFSQALIRDQHTTQADYSTVFYFNIFISLLLYGVLFTLSPSISAFFKEPQLILMIRVISIVLIINALGIIQRVLLIKEVDFKTQSKISIIAVLISGIITITLAFLGFGAWSLVINIVSMQFIQTLLLWIFNKWIPSLTFNVQSFKRFFNFGYKLLLSGLIDTFYENIYYLLIGRFYSSAQLGLFTNAVKIRDLASMSIATTVQRVTYPILSSMQEDEERLKLGFRKIIKMSAFINFPLMMGLAAVAHPLFLVLLGDKWISSVVYFQFLCLGGMLYPLHAINLNILQVKGRSDLFLFIEIIKNLLLTVLLLLSFYFKLGIMGLIAAAVIHSYLSLFVNTYFSTGEIAYSFKEQLRDLVPVYFISIIMGVIVWWMGSLLPENPLIKLSCQVSIGVFLFIAGCKLFKIEELVTTYHIIKPFVKKIKYLNRIIYSAR